MNYFNYINLKKLLILFFTLLATSQFSAAKTHLNMGLVLEPPHLDPTAGAAAAIDEIVYANVFEGLTRINRNGEVLPALAKSWDISVDGLTYTFNLQPGVMFHDGSEFDASDAVFSLKRAMAGHFVVKGIISLVALVKGKSTS